MLTALPNLQELVVDLKDESKKNITRIRALSAQLDTDVQEFWDNSPDLLAVISPNGKILDINGTWESALGYTKKEMKNFRLIDIVSNDDKLRTLAAIRELQLSRNMKFVNRCLTKDGKIIILEWNAKWSDNKYFVSARLSEEK